MNENLVKRNECLARTVIKGLESRNMSGYYAADKEEALKQALQLIPEGSSIAMGGCMSAHEIGLIKALEEGNYNYMDRDKMERRAALMAANDADVFLSSANAITYLEQKRLDPWTHNKTIQKARESYRITPGQKEYLKTLKL